VDRNEPNTVPGKTKGLVVILDLHKDLNQLGSVSTDENFFSGMINPTGVFHQHFMRTFFTKRFAQLFFTCNFFGERILTKSCL
jgi:hypothetical protein